MTAERLDVALVRRDLARSRSAAVSAIAEGRVTVDGAVAARAATAVGTDAELAVDGGPGYVGRAAHKLHEALRRFAVDPAGRLALDVGASTGGFTQVLLRAGARRVVALDVGHGQLVPELREHPRVVVVEGENARWLTAARLTELTGTAEPPGVVVADLSFISLRLVLPAIAAVAAPEADVICLIKPQFEVGRAALRGGVVRDPAARADAVLGVLDAAGTAGLRTVSLIASPLLGAAGNREVLVHLHRSRGWEPAEWSGSIGAVVLGPEGDAR